MITGFNHVGLSVANLDRSIAFYRDVLGMEVTIETTFGDSTYARILGFVQAKGRVADLKLGTLQLELFEFQEPRPTPANPDRPVSDHGITHFCVTVCDIDACYARLHSAGVRFHCPPAQFEGARATYARDPDGNVIELIEFSA